MLFEKRGRLEEVGSFIFFCLLPNLFYAYIPTLELRRLMSHVVLLEKYNASIGQKELETNYCSNAPPMFYGVTLLWW